MKRLIRQIQAAIIGALSAVLVFSFALAASPTLSDYEPAEENSIVEMAEQITDADMYVLEKYMDSEILDEIKAKLVEDQNMDIIICYAKEDPDFIDILRDYVKNKGNIHGSD